MNQSAYPTVHWASYGISAGMVDQRLAPICTECGPHLARVEPPGDPAQSNCEDSPWDLLFVGYEARGQGTLESLIRRICQAHALEGVIAVAPSDSPAREIELMRAGASAVIHIDSDPERIEQAIQGAVGALQARRGQCDREKMRLINQLAVSVNHEINNPLTGLMGTAELLLMDSGKFDEKTLKDLKTIVKQCKRIQEVTARLKTLNQLRTVPYGSHDTMLDLVGEIPLASPVPPETPDEQFLPVPSILVVDDNPLMIDLIERLFESRFKIDAAGCASDALARIREKGYDLVLIDLILPEMNGLELFRAIRKIRPHQKAMLATAYRGDARVEQAIAEGALGCIYKPFQMDELEKVLTETIKMKTINLS
ncbi:response regulator [bacterium]|nr:response regulator [bacterium]